MFNFNVWRPSTCNDMPDCGQNCHDLNPCSDGAKYTDASGNSRFIFSTFDQDWNLTCMSGISCDQEVYDLPPKYHRHYAPCCWAITVVGGSGIGACGKTCEKDYTYYIDSPNYIIDEISGTAEVYLRHNFYGHGTGGCNTPPGSLYPFYSGEVILGTINDLACGMPGSALSVTINDFSSSGVLALCDYSDMTVTYSGLYNSNKCQKYWNGRSYTGGFESENQFNLDFSDCVPIEEIITSGWPGCYTQDGTFISFDDPWQNSYTINTAESVGFYIPKFEVSGVIGHDNIPQSSAFPYTCNDCEQINHEWFPGNWNGETPFSPSAICCDCPETDMCLDRWSLDLSHPSGFIVLNSESYGEVARWSKEILDVSGECPIEISGGPHIWTFDFFSQATPSSGDLPVESGFWNRCDFSSSKIELTYNTDLVDFPAQPSGECEEVLVNQPNGYCHACYDRHGPAEFMVTIDLGFESRPFYTTSFLSSGPYGPLVSYDPPLFCALPQHPDCLGVEKMDSAIVKLGDLPNGVRYEVWDQIMDFNINSDTSCVINCDPTLVPCYKEATQLHANFDCNAEDNINGTFILSKNPGSCTDATTIRTSGECPCHPCSSGLQPINSCTWGMYPNTCGLMYPDVFFDTGDASRVPQSGYCPCQVGPCDAPGNCANDDIYYHCAGCEDYIHSECLWGLDDVTDVTISSYERSSNCLCCAPGPTVKLAAIEIGGILKLQLTVSYDGTIFHQNAIDCGFSATEYLDVPTSSLITGYDCSGSPYMEDAIDCNQPIDHTFTIPNNAIFVEDVNNPGNFYTPNCHTGGTVRVESL